MAAGDPFTINTDVTVYHDGPFSMCLSREIIRFKLLTLNRYMARAPAAAVDFDGSGEVWFKILDMGPTFSGGQATWPLYGMLITILCRFNADNESRLVLLSHPNQSPEWRLPASVRTARNPQPLPSRDAPILYRMRSNNSHKWRNRNPRASRFDSWMGQGRRTGLRSEYL
jgi:hypothetical protein